MKTMNCLLVVILSVFLFCSTVVLVNGNESDADATKPDPASDESPEEISIPSNVVSPSIDADITFRFTRPTIVNNEMPIGKEVHFLVGFKNKGEREFILNTLDASFRYAPDYSYSLQNFSTLTFNRVVEPQQESTLAYTFYISEQYAARSYGFAVNLVYSDKDGVQYQNAVFNETVSLVELDTGLDRETFFVYILLIVFTGLLAYGGYQLLLTYTGIGKRSSPSQRVSTSQEPTKEALAKSKEVDYEWLPSTVIGANKVTKTSSGRAAAN